MVFTLFSLIIFWIILGAIARIWEMLWLFYVTVGLGFCSTVSTLLLMTYEWSGSSSGLAIVGLSIWVILFTLPLILLWWGVGLVFFWQHRRDRTIHSWLNGLASLQGLSLLYLGIALMVQPGRLLNSSGWSPNESYQTVDWNPDLFWLAALNSVFFVPLVLLTLIGRFPSGRKQFAIRLALVLITIGLLLYWRYAVQLPPLCQYNPEISCP
ncbi:MAG TPA: hypothetical protein V6C88_14320 [Chroococcidiopsis sp.]